MLTRIIPKALRYSLVTWLFISWTSVMTFTTVSYARTSTIKHDGHLDEVASQHLQQILTEPDRATIDAVGTQLRAAGLADAQILPFATVGTTATSIESAFETFRDETAKVREMTHYGIARHIDKESSRNVLVAIFSRRLVSSSKFPSTVSEKALTIPLYPSVEHKIRDADIEGFLESPNGKIRRIPIERNWLSGQAELRIQFADGPGRYVFEIMVDNDRGPEASLLWTFSMGVSEKQHSKAPEDLLLPDDKSTLLALVHRSRLGANVKPLTEDRRLSLAAHEYAQNVCRTLIAAHITPQGQTAADRAQQHGYRGPLAENVAIAQTVGRAHQNILQSPSHKYNLISSTFTHIGIGIASRKAQAKSSAFDKRPNRTWCVVQLFGLVR